MSDNLFYQKYLKPDFKNFINSLNDFETKCILWACISNVECPEKFYKFVLGKVEESNKKALESNYIGRGVIPELELKEFTIEEGNKLKLKLKELDGTLLMSVIWKILESHKIFN